MPPKRGPSNHILHKLWSDAVRKRDRNTCQICSAVTSIQAHHGIVKAGRSLATRFLVENGISLCYRCHIHGAHSGDSFGKIVLDKIEAWMINRLGQTRYDEIRRLSKTPCKLSALEREALKAKLQALGG